MLNGKTALITGSTSGIGLGIANALAAQGANVILNGFGDAAEIVLLAPQPTKQFVQIEQVAAFAVFLASDQAVSITGAVLPIDGGWTAQ